MPLKLALCAVYYNNYRYLHGVSHFKRTVYLPAHADDASPPLCTTWKDNVGRASTPVLPSRKNMPSRLLFRKSPLSFLLSLSCSRYRVASVTVPCQVPSRLSQASAPGDPVELSAGWLLVSGASVLSSSGSAQNCMGTTI